MECRRLPLAQKCENSGCTCADGWEPVYNLSLDGSTLLMHCILQCSLGEYARIDKQTSAKVRLPRVFEKLTANS